MNRKHAIAMRCMPSRIVDLLPGLSCLFPKTKKTPKFLQYSSSFTLLFVYIYIALSILQSVRSNSIISIDNAETQEIIRHSVKNLSETTKSFKSLLRALHPRIILLNKATQLILLGNIGFREFTVHRSD